MEDLNELTLAKKLIFFAANLLRLLDQSGQWTACYAQLRLEGKHAEAVRIRDTYLVPLDRKINALVERGLLEL
jgi:hypothetical protein